MSESLKLKVRDLPNLRDSRIHFDLGLENYLHTHPA